MVARNPYEELKVTVEKIKSSQNLGVKIEELGVLLQLPSKEKTIVAKVNTLLIECLSTNTESIKNKKIIIPGFDDFFSKLDGFYEKKDKDAAVDHLYQWLRDLAWNGEFEKINKVLEETMKKGYDRRLLVPLNTLVRPSRGAIPDYNKRLLQTIIKTLNSGDISSTEKMDTIERLFATNF